MLQGHPVRRFLPSTVRQRGCALLHQQCWLWGRDIKRDEGNLLLLHGFDRLRPPEGLSGSSQYNLRLGSGLQIRLWGFGLFFGGEEGIFVNRFDFTPREAQAAQCWQGIEAMTDLPRAGLGSSLPEALRWIGAYEAWVLQRLGTGYRRACLASWPAAVSTPALLPDAWLELAAEVTSCIGRGAGADALADGQANFPGSSHGSADADAGALR